MNGIFAVHKPSGPTSQDIVGKLKHIFTKSPQFAAQKPPVDRNARRSRKNKFIKIGHGGTLDPLADGVLVIGIGSGTKQLANYLGQCTKVYRATAVLGCSTTTYDSEGTVYEYGKVDPQTISDEQLQAVLPNFRGSIKQIPPVYSALKMEGKPLYEYARENKPLPKPIEARECEITQLTAKLNSDPIELPANFASELEIKFITNVLQESGSKSASTNSTDDAASKTAEENKTEEETQEASTPSSPAYTGRTVELTFSVSSGTYIRTLIHDIGAALGTGAYMTKLTRIQQGDWELGKNVLPLKVFDGEDWWPTLETTLTEGPKRVLEAAVEDVE